MTLVGCLMLLDKVVKEKHEPRDSNSQLRHSVSDLRAPMHALKDSLISRSHRAETGENEIQKLILRQAELQHKLNSQPHC